VPAARRQLIIFAASESVGQAIAVDLDRIPSSSCAAGDGAGCSISISPAVRGRFLGRFYFAGDQVTWRTGWQEGAVIAAWGAVQSINRQTRHG
jgi:hypothetical protein